MHRRRSRRIIGALCLLLASLLFGGFFTLGSRRLWPGPDGGHGTAVDGVGLYLPSRTFRPYGQDAPEPVPLDRITAELSLHRGGFARIVFGRTLPGRVGEKSPQTPYHSFCISLTEEGDVASGFWSHPPDADSQPVGTTDTAALAQLLRDRHQFPEAFPAEFDDERYEDLRGTRAGPDKPGAPRTTDFLPGELIRRETWLPLTVVIQREGTALVATIDGQAVARLDNPGDFVTGGGLAAGVASGRFPGCFLKRIALEGEGDFRAGQQFPWPYSTVGAIARRTLKGAAIGLLAWGVATLLLSRSVVGRAGQVAGFEMGVLATAGAPVLLATGPGSGMLIGVGVGIVVLVWHGLFLYHCGGLRPLRLKPCTGSWLRATGLAGLLLLTSVLVLATGPLGPGLRKPYLREFRDVTVTFHITLDKSGPSVAEFFFRKTMQQQWYALRLSSDPESPCRFVSSIGREQPWEAANDLRVLTPGKKYTVRLSLVGDTFRAWIDGKDLGRFQDDQLKVGKHGLVSRAGAMPAWGIDSEVRIERSIWPGLMETGRRILLPWLAAVGWGVLLCRRRFRASLLGPLAWASLPLAVAAVGAIGRQWRPEASLWVGALASLAVLLLLTVCNREAIAFRRSSGLLLTLGLLYLLNGLAAQTSIAQRIAGYTRPSGYITKQLYQKGRWSPSEVMGTYERRFRFRGAEPGVTPLEKTDPNRPRILVLGGSSTWGYGVTDSETYPLQLQQRLRDQQIDCEVLNGGVAGSTSAMALAFYRATLHRYAPDVVVLNFGYNDANRWVNKTYTESLADNQREQEPGGRRSIPALVQWLFYTASRRPVPAHESKRIVPIEHFKEVLAEWVALSRDPKTGFRLVLVSEPFDTTAGYLSGPQHQAYADWMKQTADPDPAIDYLDAQAVFEARPLNHLFFDRVHHTVRGNRRMARLLVPLFAPAPAP